MTHLHDTTQISRRKVLAGLGAIGVASAGAGFGSAAFLTDRERLADNYLEAGRLDLLVDYRATYSPWGYQPVDDDGTPYPVGDTTVDEDSGEEGPMYVVGMAPDLRTEDGTVVDNATWSAASLQLDACQPLDGQFPLDVDGDDGGTVTVTRGDATVGGEALENFSADFVDGPDGMLFRLDDVKPNDCGEATISLHVCDNPAYLWLRTEAGFDDENTVYEPEEEAGETGASEWIDGGELDDFVWVRVFYDPDCSNSLGGDEIVMYEGSLAGFVEYAGDGLPFDPLRDAGLRDVDGTDTESTASTGDRIDVVVVSGNPTCADFGLSRAVKVEDVPGVLGTTTYPTPAGDVELTVTGLKDGSEALTFDWSADFGVDRVIVKAANGAQVYVYDEATGDTGLTTAFGNGISHVSFCYDSEGGGDDPEEPVDPQDDPGICYEPGTHCIAMEWCLPDNGEFAVRPSDVAETDDPINGAFPSLADELIAKFGYADSDEIDVNVVQSDATTFTLGFGAVQCRHNTNNENPFGSSDTAESSP